MLKKKAPATPTTTTTRRVRIPDQVQPLTLPNNKDEKAWARWTPPERDAVFIVMGTKGVWSFFQLYLHYRGGEPCDAAFLIPYKNRHLKGAERVEGQIIAPIANIKRVLSWKEVSV